MNGRPSRADFVVVGAGVCGLLLCRSLARTGYDVVLLEKAGRLGAGSTTRNEGWLHHGAYHGSSIADPSEAIDVARRCRVGAEQIKAIAPESIEDAHLPSYAFTRTAALAERVGRRWMEAAVQHDEIRPASLADAAGVRDCEAVVAAWRVADVAVHTPVLCAALAGEITRLGVRVATDSRVLSYREGVVRFTTRERDYHVTTAGVVIAAGYGTPAVLASLGLATERQLRFWRSHLVAVPRWCRPAVYSLDPLGPTLMHHGRISVVGVNEDAESLMSPTTKTSDDGIGRVVDAMAREFDHVADPSRLIPFACTKVDVALPGSESRSLAPSIIELGHDALAVLPGKLTEAPVVAHEALRVLTRAVSLREVQSRPIDSLLWD